MSKRILACLLLVACALLLSACGQQPAAQDPTPAITPEPTPALAPGEMYYEGTLPTNAAQDVRVSFILTADKAAARDVTVTIGYMEYEQQNGNSIQQNIIQNSRVTQGQPTALVNGQLDLPAIGAHLTVLDACAWGAVDYTYQHSSASGSSFQVPLGEAAVVLYNQTAPGELPAEVTGWMAENGLS